MIRGWKTKVSENLHGVSEQNKFNPFVDRLPPSDLKKTEESDESEEEEEEVEQDEQEGEGEEEDVIMS